MSEHKRKMTKWFGRWSLGRKKAIEREVALEARRAHCLRYQSLFWMKSKKFVGTFPNGAMQVRKFRSVHVYVGVFGIRFPRPMPLRWIVRTECIHLLPMCVCVYGRGTSPSSILTHRQLQLRLNYVITTGILNMSETTQNKYGALARPTYRTDA